MTVIISGIGFWKVLFFRERNAETNKLFKWCTNTETHRYRNRKINWKMKKQIREMRGNILPVREINRDSNTEISK